MANISPEEKSILNAMIYYDIFDHPLSYEELCHSILMYKLTPNNGLKASIQKLQKQGIIGEKKQFYYLRNKEWSVDNRLSEQKRVKHLMRKARNRSRIIASFPFVRGVFISGSLSKDRAEKKGDIDYFIITEPGKLWISRTLLVLFKKLFLFNSYKYFCLNYFVDDKSMEISNKNIYTATDIVTLIPVYNQELYLDFMHKNKWAFTYYPNYPQRKAQFIIRPWSGKIKKAAEFLFNGNFGNKLDNWLRKQTLYHRRKKFCNLPEQQFNRSFITEKNISTHHPNDFQEFVLKRFKEKQRTFEKELMLSLRQDKQDR